jgi:DUF2075 family protein
MFTYICCYCYYYSYDVDDVYILGLSAVVNRKTEEKEAEKKKKKTKERIEKKNKTVMYSNGCHVLLARSLMKIKIYLFERKKRQKIKSISELNYFE